MNTALIIALGLVANAVIALAWWANSQPDGPPEISDLDLDPELYDPLGPSLDVRLGELIDDESIRELSDDGKTAVCRYCECRVPLSFMRSICVEDGIFDSDRPFEPFRDVGDSPCEFFCAHCLDGEDFPDSGATP